MTNDINIVLVNYLKTIFDFNNNELMKFYNVFIWVDDNKKNELLIKLDEKLKEKNKILSNLSTKISLTNNKIEEFKEKQQLKEITF